MIPPLDARGLLPPGQHDCANFSELALHFATNGRRVALFQNLERFIRTELSPVAAGLHLYIGGSYLSDKPHPSDIDCTLAVPLQDLAAYRALVQLSADGAKGRIYTTYDVEFYLNADKSIIEVRSASRLGESDLGVNRDRIEAIRTKLA